MEVRVTFKCLTNRVLKDTQNYPCKEGKTIITSLNYANQFIWTIVSDNVCQVSDLPPSGKATITKVERKQLIPSSVFHRVYNETKNLSLGMSVQLFRLRATFNWRFRHA